MFSQSIIIAHRVYLYPAFQSELKSYPNQINPFMKILLVHPDDWVEAGEWARTRWDWAVDLGWSGRHVYAEKTAQLGFRIFSIYDLLDHEIHRCRMRELMALGFDQMVDSESVDWWDILSPHFYDRLEQLLLLSALVEQVPVDSEIFATRPYFSLHAVSLLLKRAGKRSEIKSFSKERRADAIDARSRRYLRAAITLHPSQIGEIAFDKWDSDYRLRRHFSRSPKSSPGQVILLPSAYGNVSRAQISYARMLPNRRFLLVVTRRNGVLRDLPGNVEIRRLAGYAPRRLRSTHEDSLGLLTRWRDLESEQIEANSIASVARELDVFADFPNLLKNMLGVRDAWREVLVREPISAVLSGDENNPTTRLPILLARTRNLRTLFCDHGALNMSLGIRRPASDIYLMRGEMARDYSVGWCGLSVDKVLVGGAAEAHTPTSAPNRTKRDWIVLYSEAYELWDGRTRSLYAELLPELCLLASHTNRRVIVKLHPFESLRMRRSVVHQVVPRGHRDLIEMREGPMTADLFERAWCSLTVESSVAVENTTNGVPCFLCSWFDPSWYDYGKQYAKYSAGYPLDSPRRIREIPQLLEGIRITEATRQRLHTTIKAEELDSLLTGR
jgi:hypothetical protein